MFTCVNLMCKLYIGKKLRKYIYIYKYECVIVIMYCTVVYNIIALALSVELLINRSDVTNHILPSQGWMNMDFITLDYELHHCISRVWWFEVC